MDDQSQDIDLNQEQKSRLLSLGLGSGPQKSRIDEDGQKMDMLYDVLTRTLPVDLSVVNSLPVAVRGLSSGLKSLAGQPIGDLLQEPKADITTIRRIKQYAKDSGISVDSEGKTDVLLVVYYAAIANALVYHKKKITQHSYQDLEQFFLSFREKDWVLEELKDLFKKAQEYCQKKGQ